MMFPISLDLKHLKGTIKVVINTHNVYKCGGAVRIKAHRTSDSIL